MQAGRTYDVSQPSGSLLIVLPPRSQMNSTYVVVPNPFSSSDSSGWSAQATGSGSSFGSSSAYSTDPFSTFSSSDPSSWSAQATGSGSTFSSCSDYNTWPFSSFWSSGPSDSSSSFGSRRAYSLPSLRPFLSQNISARIGRNWSWM